MRDAARPMSEPMTACPRILAVDDERLGVDLMVRALRRVGDVTPVVSGEDAWALLQEESFDLVISDQRMPGMSGVELLARVAKHDVHVGRILLTGYADIHATVDAINDGQVHAYLNKPCPQEALVASVQAVLDRVALSRENERLVVELREGNHALETALQELGATQKRVVEAERLSAIGSMIATIVHDFRGPLSIIGSAGRCLVDGGLDSPGELRECAAQIQEESQRMTRMCAELQDVTRISAEAAERVLDDLDPMVEAAMAGLVEEAGRAGVEIELDLCSGVRLPLDEDRLRRALLNLGYNALEAMPMGGRLHVSSVRDGDTVVVAVRDTGQGIPEEIRSRVFEPFVTAGKRNGSGLGLAIVQRVVREHDGRIEIAKPEGGGTSFELHLPIRCEQDAG